MGLECGGIKDSEGVGGRIYTVPKSTVGVGKEESQQISKFADDSFS